MAVKKNVSVISVEKPTWFPLTDEMGAFPVYGAPITIGTAVSIKPEMCIRDSLTTMQKSIVYYNYEQISFQR